MLHGGTAPSAVVLSGSGMVASGGTLSDYEASGTMYRAHHFYITGAFFSHQLSLLIQFMESC